MTIPKLVTLKKIGSPDIGYLSIVETIKDIPFVIKRVYWTYGTPDQVIRGHHAHKNLQQMIIAVSGRLNFSLENRNGDEFQFILSEANQGLLIPSGYWRTIKFSTRTILLCLASEEYNEQDYIRNYNAFKQRK